VKQILHATVLGVLSVAVPGATPEAQTLRPLSLDATLGGGAGVGGDEVYERGGIAADALLGLRLRATRRGALIGAVSAGVQGPLGGSDVCNFGSRGQCLSDFPTLLPLAVLAGWEGQSRRRATLRVLGGPAYVRVDGDDSARQRGGAAGGQGRVDLVTPPLGPVALVGSLRGNVVPAFRGQTLATWAAGVGVRLR
jgi:hypothetical protein